MIIIFISTFIILLTRLSFQYETAPYLHYQLYILYLLYFGSKSLIRVNKFNETFKFSIYHL